jgi:hypothetical protein
VNTYASVLRAMLTVCLAPKRIFHCVCVCVCVHVFVFVCVCARDMIQ